MCPARNYSKELIRLAFYKKLKTVNTVLVLYTHVFPCRFIYCPIFADFQAFFCKLKAMGLIAMFSIIDTKAANTINTQGNTYAQNAMSDAYSAGKKLNEKIVDRAMDIQPTIRIKSGTEVKLITNLTIDLPPIEPVKPEEKYARK